MRTTRRAVLCGVAAVATASGLLPLAHANADATPPPKIARISAEQLGAATVRGDQANGATRTQVQRYLDEQAGTGRLLDAKELKVSAMPNPLGDGVVGVIWDGGSVPTGIDLTQTISGKSTQVGLGASFAEVDAPLAAGRSASGFGFDYGVNPSNMYRYGNPGCRTVYFTPSYSHTSDHWTTTCYEKWAQSGSRNWIYNRWALWTRGNPGTLYMASNRDFTIRSRPWKGYESRVSSLTGWTPAAPSSSCTARVTVTLTIGPASLGIPLHQCSNTKVLPEANVHSMGEDWDGNSSQQLYLDYGMAIVAANTSTVPIMADYLWAEVQSCYKPGPCSTYNPSQYLKLADDGW